MDRGSAPQGLQNSAQGFNPGNLQINGSPSPALPRHALFGKHPVCRVCDAEGARDAGTRYSSLLLPRERQPAQLGHAIIGHLTPLPPC